MHGRWAEMAGYVTLIASIVGLGSRSLGAQEAEADDPADGGPAIVRWVDVFEEPILRSETRTRRRYVRALERADFEVSVDPELPAEDHARLLVWLDASDPATRATFPVADRFPGDLLVLVRWRPPGADRISQGADRVAVVVVQPDGTAVQHLWLQGPLLRPEDSADSAWLVEIVRGVQTGGQP